MKALETKALEACRKGDINTMEECIAQGWNPTLKFEGNYTYPINTLITRRHTEALEYLMRKGKEFGDPIWLDTSQSLYAAITSHNLRYAKFLIENGASVNAPEGMQCPLIHATIVSDMKIVKYLLKCGANINHCTAHNTTALMDAVVSGLVPLVRLFIKHGANVNIRNNHGNTCLMIAISSNFSYITKLLIEAGANLNEKGQFGNYPLDVAYYKDNVKLPDILYLIGKGARETTAWTIGQYIKLFEKYAMLTEHVHTTDVLRFIHGFQPHTSPGMMYKTRIITYIPSREKRFLFRK